MSDGELSPQEEAAKLIRRARIKAREIETKIGETGGAYSALIYDAYNAMFMAARAALHYRGVECNSHRTVVSHYKHDIVEKKLVDARFDGHLTKIQQYWEEEQTGTKHDIDKDRAVRICEATRDLVDALAVVAGDKPAATNSHTRQLYQG